MAKGGPVAELERIQKGLKKAPTQAVKAVGDAVADDVESLILLGFEDSKAPDGSAWAPLKYRQGQPLRLTSGSGLMGSITSRFSGGYVTAGTPKPYGVYHQSAEPRAVSASGDVILPRRPFLPDDGEVPAPWQSVLEASADDALDAVMQRLFGKRAPR